MQVCLIDTRVRNLLFRSFALYSLLFCSKSLILKSDHEQFALYRSFLKSNMSDSLVIPVNHSQKTINLLNFLNIFFMCFSLLFPFFSSRSSLLCSFLKSDRSNLLYKRVAVSESLFFRSKLLFRSQKTGDSL